MKIKTNKYNLITLEEKFANDFKSPLASILAEKYFQLSKYKKAKKVCEITLKYNENNLIIKYILAKLALINDNYLKAEKLLKEVIKKDPANFMSLLLYINVGIILKRSMGLLAPYIKKAYMMDSTDNKMQKLYNQLNIVEINSDELKNNFKKKSSIKINEKLATKTMYRVFIKQKKYKSALKVLDMMKRHNKYKSFVNKEYNKVIKFL